MNKHLLNKILKNHIFETSTLIGLICVTFCYYMTFCKIFENPNFEQLGNTINFVKKHVRIKSTIINSFGNKYE